MKLKLQNVRLSFPDIFEAVQYQGTGPFNYRCTLLVPEGDPQKKAIDDAIKAVATAKWAAKAGKILAAAPASKSGICFTDGSAKEYDGYQDHWALSATRPLDKGRPAIIDRDKSPLVAADGKPYAGCYVNASVEFWAQDNKFGTTVRCGLLGIQFLRDGDAFGGGSPADPDDFDELGMDEVDDMA